METQLDWLDDIWDLPNLPKQLIKTFDEEYTEEYKEASVEPQTMTGFFSTKVRQLIENYKWNK